MYLLEHNFILSPCQRLSRKILQGVERLTLRRSALALVFVLVAEVLIQLFMQAQSLGEIKGCEVKKRVSRLPLLQFVDDTIVFSNGRFDEAER